MNDRLTYNAPGKSSQWPRLMLPLMILLSALILFPLQTMVASRFLPVSLGKFALHLPVISLSQLLYLTLSGLLIPCCIPDKSPAAIKAFASMSGILISLLFLQGFLEITESNELVHTGAALMLAGWLFSLHTKEKSLLAPLASGLLSGLSVSFSPAALSGTIALILFSLFASRGFELKNRVIHAAAWLTAFAGGLIPAINAHLFELLEQRGSFQAEQVKNALSFLVINIPVWGWVLAGLGLLVAGLQKQKILLGLVLPFLLLRLAVTGLLPMQSAAIDSTLLLPLAWFAAYGLLRLLRGIEQGVRNVNKHRAKTIPAAACAGMAVCQLAKMVDIFLLTN